MHDLPWQTPHMRRGNEKAFDSYSSAAERHRSREAAQRLVLEKLHEIGGKKIFFVSVISLLSLIPYFASLLLASYLRKVPNAVHWIVLLVGVGFGFQLMWCVRFAVRRRRQPQPYQGLMSESQMQTLREEAALLVNGDTV